MKYRKLRIAWSVGWGFVAVLLIALWVRSYWKCDVMEWQRLGTNLSFTSFRGQIGTFVMKMAGPQSTKYSNWQIEKGSEVNYNDGTGRPLPSFLGFKSSWVSAPIPLTTSTLVIPYWFPALACAVAAIVPWSRQLKWRFSLRTLLIATTLVAVGLGLSVWTMRG
jgi:hypothetical protein